MYDLIIIGQGPAGMSAGIYASIYKLKTLIIGAKSGGYATEAYQIKNYPGVPDISGIELMDKFRKQLIDLGGEIVTDNIISITKENNNFIVNTFKDKYTSKTLILANGSERKRLNIPGENELMGKGVAFCATCDAFFFKDKITAVIGGSDSAITSAIQLAEYSKKVYLIYRKEEMTGMPTWIEKAKTNPKIVLVPKTNVLKINGEKKVESIEVDREFNGNNIIALDGVFIEIGSSPVTEIIKPLGVNLNDKGYVVIDNTGATNIKGIYAAGDSTTGSNGFQQIITASSEGAIATNSAYRYLKTLN